MRQTIARRFAFASTAVALAAAVAFCTLGDGTPEGPGPTAAMEQQAEPELVITETTAATATTLERLALRDGPGVGAALPRLPFTVLVRDAESGRPVPEARVEVVESAALMRALAGAGTSLHAPAGRRLRAALATVAITDAQGTAAMQVPAGALLLEARRAARWGFLTLGRMPDDHRAELAIGFDRDLRVQVVDPDGRPRAGVPVTLRRQTDPEPRPHWSGQETLSEAPDGIATFLHFQRRLAQGPGWHLTFAFPLREQPVVPVDLATPREPPRELRLPATGGLRLRVRTHDGGKPYLGGVEVRLRAVVDGRKLAADGPWARPQLDPETGTALVAWLGLDLQIEAVLRRSESVVATAMVAGPRQPGEVVDGEIPWPHASVRFARGRFVRADGRPWPACTVEALARLQPLPMDPADHPTMQALAVDADGRFALELRHARPAEGSRTYLFAAPDPQGSGKVTAFLRLDQEVPADGLELGDVRLDHGPLLVSGRVVDPGHRPVAGAQVQVRAHTVIGAREAWRPVFTSGTQRTGEDGAFALFLPPGELEPGQRLALSTRCDGHVPDLSRGCLRGTSGVEVVLQPAGGLAGSFVFAAGWGPTDLLVTLVAAGSPAQVHPVQVMDDGTFAVDQLAAGTYSLKVIRRGPDNRPEPRPVVVVDGLQLLPGTVQRDPRIQRLAIDSPWTSVRLQVVDRSSTPLRDALVAIVGARQGAPVSTDPAGFCSVRAERLPIDLEVSAFGYRALVLRGVATDRRVELDDGLPVQMFAGARPAGREPRYQLGATLYALDAAGGRGNPLYGRAFPWQFRYFDSSGVLALKLPQPGVYELDLFVYVEGDDHVGRSGPVPLQPPRRITVVESRGAQVFELGIPQAAVDAAATRVGR